jgi:phage baseplate assembly protein W
LVLTERGERPFQPNLGCGVNALLFENMDSVTTSVVRDEIIQTIDNYEPRVSLIDVKVDADTDGNELFITIQYQVIGAEIRPQELTFALQPTR